MMILGRKKEIGTIKDRDGNYTSTPKETLSVMLDAHFPKRDIDNEVELVDLGEQEANEELIDRIVTEQAIRVLFKSFKPTKSPGTDNIYPILIQKGMDSLVKPLMTLFKKSLREEKCPRRWLESRATFIQKAGKNDAQKHTEV